MAVGYFEGWDDEPMECAYVLPFVLQGALSWDDYRTDRYPSADKAVPLGTVDPVAISEVLSDLASIAARGK